MELENCQTSLKTTTRNFLEITKADTKLVSVVGPSQLTRNYWATTKLSYWAQTWTFFSHWIIYYRPSTAAGWFHFKMVNCETSFPVIQPLHKTTATLCRADVAHSNPHWVGSCCDWFIVTCWNVIFDSNSWPRLVFLIIKAGFYFRGPVTTQYFLCNTQSTSVFLKLESRLLRWPSVSQLCTN